MRQEPQRRRLQHSGRNRQRGFTLVEVAIVVLIMGLVIGGLAMPLATQRENARLRESHEQLRETEAALKGYVLVNGFLPCPATPGSAGLADATAGACAAQHGFVPATTLGIDGSRNADSLLLDPWGSPLRYSVTRSDADGDGSWDFVTPGELSDVGLAGLLPDLAVCSSATGATATACGSPATTLSSGAPVLIYSLGRDWPSFSSPDQLENVGTTLTGGPSGARYPVGANNVFVSRGKSEQPGGEYDDVVVWVSANTLYHGLIMAGRLP